MPAPLSVIVPTKDRPHLLGACLASVRAALRESDEVIVVDSASVGPQTRDVAHAEGARYLRCDVPGASLARNHGWRHATHELIAFIDDDVRVDERWADAMSRAFDDSGVAFVTGRIGDPAPSVDDEVERGPALAQKRETEPARLDSSSGGVLGHSANLGVRRSALEAIGGFDEQLGAGGRFRAAEDLDLLDRLFAAGYIGRYEPGASAVHERWRSVGDYVRLQKDYGLGTGARIAKLVRSDRRRALRASRTAFVRSGTRLLWRAIVERNWSEALARVLRIAATVAGLVLALLAPLEGGHLRARQPAASRSVPR